MWEGVRGVGPFALSLSKGLSRMIAVRERANHRGVGRGAVRPEGNRRGNGGRDSAHHLRLGLRLSKPRPFVLSLSKHWAGRAARSFALRLSNAPSNPHPFALSLSKGPPRLTVVGPTATMTPTHT